ncbi:MAG: hypothetical protein E6R04_08480 [Spirochaetes bacterium]|nr:MAG: hypothetical protein E6R04_08480 [Spirochaetota bacterium]
MITVRYQPGDDYLTINAQGTSTNPFEPDSAFDDEYLIELGEVLIREGAGHNSRHLDRHLALTQNPHAQAPSVRAGLA